MNEPRATSPIPFEVELPAPEWASIDPASAGVTNSLFLARRSGLQADYTPTISVSGGWRTDGAPLTLIGDETLARLRVEGAQEVELVDRKVIESPTAPVLTQTIGALAPMQDRIFDLRQTQVIFGYVDLEHPGRTAILIHTLSCTYGQSTAMVDEFRRYVGSIRVSEESPDR